MYWGFFAMSAGVPQRLLQGIGTTGRLLGVHTSASRTVGVTAMARAQEHGHRAGGVKTQRAAMTGQGASVRGLIRHFLQFHVFAPIF